MVQDPDLAKARYHGHQDLSTACVYYVPKIQEVNCVKLLCVVYGAYIWQGFGRGGGGGGGGGRDIPPKLSPLPPPKNFHNQIINCCK